MSPLCTCTRVTSPTRCSSPHRLLQDIVALSGAHTVGFFELGIEQTGAHSQQWRGMDQTPNTFDSSEPPPATAYAAAGLPNAHCYACDQWQSGGQQVNQLK